MSEILRKQRLLFVCTAAQQRSPTAAGLFIGNEKYETKYCGIHPLADIPITAEAVQWADVIFCMEEVHRELIAREFPEEARGKKIVVLDIPDIYYRDDPGLIEILQGKLLELV